MRASRKKLSEVRPSDYNPRLISDEALAGLEASIKRWGCVEFLVWNKRTGNIVGGHQRYRVLEKMGVTEVDVVEVDISKNEEKALNVELNNPHIQGQFDIPKLQLVMADIKLSMGDTELQELRLDQLDLEMPEEKSREVVEDDVPAVEEKAVTRHGDLWLLDQHRVLCGDSTKVEDVMRVMGEARAVLMVTDPPYGDSWVQKAQDMHKLGYGHSRAGLHGCIASDDLSERDLAEFLGAFLEAAKVAGDPPFPGYVWHGTKRILFEQALIKAGYHVHQPVIWVKPSFVISRKHYHPRCEWALHGWLTGGGACPFYGQRNQSDVWAVVLENNKIHPTQKPVELYAIPIRNHTRAGEVMYDPFLGSGTAIMAAEQLWRRCYGLEIEPKYCDVIIRRWQNFTNKIATLDGDGRSFDQIAKERNNANGKKATKPARNQSNARKGRTAKAK